MLLSVYSVSIICSFNVFKVDENEVYCSFFQEPRKIQLNASFCWSENYCFQGDKVSTETRFSTLE